jgi:phosphatidate phosphatase PAH1
LPAYLITSPVPGVSAGESEDEQPYSAKKKFTKKPEDRDVDVALKKADIVEKQMLAGTDEHDTVAATTFTEEVQKRLQNHVDSVDSPPVDMPLRPRSMSETSAFSDMSSFEEGSSFALFENSRQVRYKKTLRLKSAQLKDLKLQYGPNTATFSISSHVQGTATASCHIYLLRSSERIVISDVDGTITKSDVLGHIIPAIGGTWAHTSIVNLYRRIQDNGYRIIYLSSRAIGQSHQTKQYLSSIIQSSKKLPDGPVLLSPTSVLMAFRKEIIERKPDEFKIACLTDLMSLFPEKCPFYAGFGNRETDIKSYNAVGIPPERIFIIDPSSKVENASNIGFVTNYGNMLRDNVVDLLFPPMFTHTNSDLNNSTNNSFSYWQSKSDELKDSDMEKYERKRQARNKKKSRWYSFY